MDDKQRQRQARINQSMMSHLQQHEAGLFQHTYMPEYKHYEKMYRKTGRNSIWNNLPVLPVEQHGRVAYVSPINIVKFLFANGMPVDDMLFDLEASSLSNFDANNDAQRLIEHVCQNQKTVKWKEDLCNRACETGLAKSTKAVLLWACDWKDGFGPSRSKNNRGSVDCMTIILSPPKDSVNKIHNTFLVGVGPKKSKEGWRTVARKFKDDMRQLSLLDKPFYIYHGTLQKMIPVFFRRYASIQDKMERPESTVTIGCKSTIHRCYGTVGIIKTPKCDTEGIQDFLNDEFLGLKDSHWGWCDEFIDNSEGANGANLPSCKRCRRERLVHLGIFAHKCKAALKSNDSDSANQLCEDCANWTQLDGDNPQTMLQFSPPKDYPEFGYEGCPVNPPEGREPGLEHLQQIELMFQLMIDAVKYTYYHVSAQKTKSTKLWTKGKAETYLRTCGIAKNIAEEILDAAAKDHAEGLSVDYSDKEGIGSFRFPAPWLGELSAKEYIEGVMHLLYLGIADYLLEISTLWLKQVKETTAFPLNATQFRRDIQPLLRDLKSFQLGWLMAYKFTGEGSKKKG